MRRDPTLLALHARRRCEVLAGSALSVAATVAAWLVLVAVGGACAAGLAAPHPVMVTAVALASPLAVLAALRTIVSVWRGPSVISFEAHAAWRCGPAEAALIREVAQLRGTMGGAGHVHRPRLAFPIVAWAAALLAGAQGIFDEAGGAGCSWPFAVALAAALAAWLFPARPYWYREVTGGGVIVTPPIAGRHLESRRALRVSGTTMPAARETPPVARGTGPLVGRMPGGEAQ